jgi:hypothetical protein
MSPATHLDQRLAAFVAAWQSRTFAWGQSDCCQFAREAAQALHGLILQSPAYASERGAYRALRRFGGLTGLFQRHGLHERPLRAARRGDFIVYQSAAGGLFAHGVALVTGPQAHAPSSSGLVCIDRAAWLQCWGVPNA